MNSAGQREGLNWLLMDGPGGEVNLDVEREGSRRPIRLVFADRV